MVQISAVEIWVFSATPYFIFGGILVCETEQICAVALFTWSEGTVNKMSDNHFNSCQVWMYPKQKVWCWGFLLPERSSCGTMIVKLAFLEQKNRPTKNNVSTPTYVGLDNKLYKMQGAYIKILVAVLTWYVVYLSSLVLRMCLRSNPEKVQVNPQGLCC